MGVTIRLVEPDSNRRGDLLPGGWRTCCTPAAPAGHVYASNRSGRGQDANLTPKPKHPAGRAPKATPAHSWSILFSWFTWPNCAGDEPLH